MLTRVEWPINPLALVLRDEEGRPLARRLAWEVRPEGEDQTAIWAVKCITLALDAGQRLALLTPVEEDEVGGWAYEQFKRRGCEHCRSWRRQAVLLRFLPQEHDLWAIIDGAGHKLCGLKDLNVQQAPIRVPDHFDELTLPEAELIREVVRMGLATPIFR
jgi:hypothetical protein